MKRNVLFIVWNWDTSGGLQLVTTQVAAVFRELGWGVTVWSVLDREPATHAGIASEALAPRGAIAGAFHRRWGWRANVAARLAAEPKFDLVMFGHVNLLRLVADGFPKECPPAILWAHGNEVWGPMGARFRTQLESLARVVAVSRFTQMEILAHSPEARVSVVANPVDTDFYTPAEDPATIRRDEILICGRMSAAERYKGHDVLIEAMPIASRILGRSLRLRVIGDGDDRERLEKLAIGCGLGSVVTFTGRVGLAELREAYRNCGVFALPSQVIIRHVGHWGGEGFGVVLLEAAACGRPVIASSEGGSPDALVPGETGLLVTPSDPESVASAIADILRDPDRADAMGAAGRKLMESRFTLGSFRESIRVVADEIVPPPEL